MPGESKKIVKYIASLAKLKIEEEKFDKIAEHFEKVLHYVKILEELELDRVEPMPYPHEAFQRLRRDVPHETTARQAALEEAPDVYLHFFRAPSPLRGIIKRKGSQG